MFIKWLKAWRSRVWHSDDSTDQFLGRTPEPEYPVTANTLPHQRLRVNNAFFTGHTYLRQGERADWQQCDHRIMRFAAHLVEELRKQGVPMFVHSAFRTREQQSSLVAAGRSKASWPVSAHNQGKAVDIVHSRFAWDMTPEEWAYIGKVGKRVADRLDLEVEWGGDWRFYDPAHWQVGRYRDEGLRNLYSVVPVRRTPRHLLRMF